MASKEEPMLSRLDRLDIMIGYLEELRGSNKSVRSSWPSTPSSGTATSDGSNSSITSSSPKSLEKHCRPIDTVAVETQAKGTLVERLVQLENRVLKLSLQFEEEMEAQRRTEVEEMSSHKKTHERGIKRLVKSCVKGKPPEG